MSATRLWFAGAGFCGVLLASPAFAMCGGQDKNGCSVSPVTYKSCSKDLKGDLKDLKCDIIDLIKDIRHDGNNGDIRSDIRDLREDLKEIQFDRKILASLKKPNGRDRDRDDD